MGDAAAANAGAASAKADAAAAATAIATATAAAAAVCCTEHGSGDVESDNEVSLLRHNAAADTAAETQV